VLTCSSVDDPTKVCKSELPTASANTELTLQQQCSKLSMSCPQRWQHTPKWEKVNHVMFSAAAAGAIGSPNSTGRDAAGR
jgi:hypothetical protein